MARAGSVIKPKVQDSVDATVEYSWRCPKCGKWCASKTVYAICNGCHERFTLTVKGD